MGAPSVWVQNHAIAPSNDGWDAFLKNPRDSQGRLMPPNHRPGGEEGQIWDHAFGDRPSAGLAPAARYRSGKDR